MKSHKLIVILLITTMAVFVGKTAFAGAPHCRNDNG